MAYCGNIINFLQNCENSRGGVKSIMIGNYVDGAVQWNSGHTEVTGVTSAVTFYNFPIRKNTCSMTSTATIDFANGTNYVTTELSAVFTKQDSAKRLSMNSLLLTDAIAVVTDANNIHYLLGSESPVNASAGTSETGTSATDGSKYTITMQDESNGFPPILSNTVYESLNVHEDA